MDRDALIEVALRHLAEGTLEPDVLVPVLRDLIGEQEGTPVSLGDLVSALGERGGGSFDALRERVKQLRVDLAGRVNQARRTGQEIPPECRRNLSDLPLDASLDWRTQADCGERFELALGMLRDHFYAANKQVDAPAAASLVGEAFRRSVEDLERTPRPWSILGLSQLVRNTLDDDPDAALRERLDELQALIERQQAADRQAVEDALDRWPEFPLPEALDEAAVIEGLRQRFWSAPDPTAKRGWLDLILSWPTDRVVSLVLEIAQVPWIQDRVTLMTKLRFGGQRINSWSARRQWLQEKKQAEDRLARRLRENSPELLLFWAMCSPEPVGELIAALDAHCRDRSPAVDPEAFFDRWREQLDPQEASLMLDLPVLAAAPVEPAAAVVESQQTPGDEQAAAPPPVPLPPMESAPVPKLSPVPHRPRVPRQPRPTPLWKEHLRGFLAENGYLFAGILMVLVGSSLTALFTWDWGWVWRYTLMPALLGTFTFALAWVGDSLEKRDERLLGTGAILRGAAICLLPANFMAVALLAGDPEVPNQQLMLLMMGGIYVVLFGWGLNRWCRQVEPRIGIVIPAALMLLNGLVLLRPTALLLGKVQPDALNLTLGSGFHLGFVIGAASLIWFIRRVLTAEMAFERRVPLFVGAVLGVTFLEVLGWVHGSMRELPRVYTYSTMMVLSGGVVLLCEQRVLALRRREAEHLEASFLGFALILLGIMMGFSQPYMRIACLTLGGVIWVGQALPRRNPLHHAIGLSMFCLGVASVGLLPVYPRAWLPALGLGLSVALAFIADRDRPALKEAAHGLLSVVLTLTSITAVLAQWHYQTPPLATACQLLILAVLMFWRGQRDEMPMWVHGGMLMLALALPYLGCVDLSEHPARGNTMSFGLSVIAIGWLLTIRLSGSELLRHARSTVLLFYGGLALAALVLRVGFESAQPPDADD